MSLLQVIEWLRTRAAKLRRTAWGALALLVVLDALPFFVDKSHAHIALERLPGFWALFGLAGAFLLIFFAKGLGRVGIQQREDYYDD